MGIGSATAMCDYLRNLFRKAESDLHIHRADMTASQLANQFDLILLLLGSTTHTLDENPVRREFACVAGHLSHRGI